ncbi:hypothetical protein ACFW04_003592 [Cataglyphis niger]
MYNREIFRKKSLKLRRIYKRIAQIMEDKNKLSGILE